MTSSSLHIVVHAVGSLYLFSLCKSLFELCVMFKRKDYKSKQLKLLHMLARNISYCYVQVSVPKTCFIHGGLYGLPTLDAYFQADVLFTVFFSEPRSLKTWMNSYT